MLDILIQFILVNEGTWKLEQMHTVAVPRPTECIPRFPALGHSILPSILGWEPFPGVRRACLSMAWRLGLSQRLVSSQEVISHSFQSMFLSDRRNCT